MEIVTPTGDSIIKIIPRLEKEYVAVIYRNVSTDKTLVSDNKVGIYTDNTLSFTFTESEKQTLNITDGQFVNFEVVGSEQETETQTELLYRGRIFVTEQVISQTIDEVYDINEGEYTENQSENEYIIF